MDNFYTKNLFIGLFQRGLRQSDSDSSTQLNHFGVTKGAVQNNTREQKKPALRCSAQGEFQRQMKYRQMIDWYWCRLKACMQSKI